MVAGIHRCASSCLVHLIDLAASHTNQAVHQICAPQSTRQQQKSHVSRLFLKTYTPQPTRRSSSVCGGFGGALRSASATAALRLSLHGEEQGAGFNHLTLAKLKQHAPEEAAAQGGFFHLTRQDSGWNVLSLYKAELNKPDTDMI